MLPGSAIADGSTNLVDYQFVGPTAPSGLNLTVTGDVIVDAGGSINADAKGYAGGVGPGGGWPSGSPASGSGAGHGGNGGSNAGLAMGGAVYDYVQQPVDKGSGGGSAYSGPGGAGGGAIKLVVGGALLINGTMSASGAAGFNARSGGGAGGSIWLVAQTLAGTGQISANGGSGELPQGGGGGGGCIALQPASYAFSGQISALGGAGFSWGGAGTIYTAPASQAPGQLLVDNGGHSGMTMLSPMAQGLDLVAQGGAVLTLPGSLSFRNLRIGSNACLVLSNQSQTLTVTSNATIDPGGSITADSNGYLANQGTGAGHYYYSISGIYTGGGGGHGGLGASGAGGSPSSGGPAYGSLTSPNEPGSGGGACSYSGPTSLGSAGGGVVRLNVAGMLVVNGRLSANGGDGLSDGSGGGAGGSIWLFVGTLAGGGTVSANGGMGNGFGLYAGGGGGGGRIAVQYGQNLFYGTMSAWGGGGSAWGGAGTIYSKANNSSSGQVLVDNGGVFGTNTPWMSAGTVDLTLSGGALVSIPDSQSQYFGNLFIGANSWLIVTNPILTVSGSATIQSGGGLLADGTGYLAGAGPGAGRYYSVPGVSGSYTCGGGGYGGYGASGAGTTSLSGGTTYGSVTAPYDLGSGGGGPYSYYALGGAGGGAIRLSVTGTLEVDGRLSANGAAAVTSGGGGGSGGTVALTVGTLSGTGVISANGGTGIGLGGGGGGGRIALQYGLNAFAGSLTACGGGGSSAGGAGTIYSKANTSSIPQLLADNGGQLGTNTAWVSIGIVDLTLTGGALVLFPSGQILGSLFIGSNSWLVTSNLLTVNSNATIRAGGGILSDGCGYGGGSGPGAGRYYSLTGGGYTAGGGGYGGYGAAGSLASGPSGGGSYGSLTSPTDPGSGGGGSSTTCLGGSGGGALHLNVTGVLAVDGVISANGNPGVTAGAGGGSGGGVWLSAGTLSGLGVIAANGGNGIGLGGGGGGGRIALQYNLNVFAGSLMARGGSGSACGGAGTIYTKANSASTGQLVVDNGGQPGTNTAWTSTGPINLTVTGGAVASLPASQSLGTLVVGSNSWLVVTNQTLTITSNATIQTGGGILADGTGNTGGNGPGAGRYYYIGTVAPVFLSGGGGYGGYGANGGSNSLAAGGPAYGYLSSPTDLGSGGGGSSQNSCLGGAGGGAVHLNVTGALAVDGRISANGAPGVTTGAGGGSGGSIWLTVGTLSGAGSISANGGLGNGQGGGGGGGRIAIQYTANVFEGSLSACGGGGYACGGAGTIYTKANNQPIAQVVADNGGLLGTNTTWSSTSFFDLTVKGGAVVALPAGQSLNNLFIASNAWLSVNSQSQSVTISANATVEAGGGIIADGAGYSGGQGPGAGRYTYLTGYGNVGGGGGYGGCGAAGAGTNLAWGGTTYGSLTTPTDQGSGGSGSLPTDAGAGGGALHLNVTGALLLNGRLSANGTAGSIPGAGGGSGGSVWLTVGTLSGAGIISANGGAGNALGGGGGGGRLAIQYAVNAFSGTMRAYGGSGGSSWGGAGTVYLKANSQPIGSVSVDNGGRFGTNTFLAAQALPFDLTIRNGATVCAQNNYLVLSNLVVGAGGSLSASTLLPLNPLDLEVLRDATIETNGVITVDGKGFPSGSGPGQGFSYNSIGSGAGYGGAGGASSVSQGGSTYGSAQQPFDLGSGGGFGYYGGQGGSEGGGAIRLTVGRALTINGLVTACGHPGQQDNAGGGSGGSIWIMTGIFEGAGLVAADGGAAESYLGGGGGGGRIAIYSPVNAFNGGVSVAGGDGYAPGQAGTVFSAAVFPSLFGVSHSPVGAVIASVSSVDIAFNAPVNPYTVYASDATLTTPTGIVSAAEVSVAATGPASVRVSFPAQIAEGAYTFNFGPSSRISLASRCPRSIPAPSRLSGRSSRAPSPIPMPNPCRPFCSSRTAAWRAPTPMPVAPTPSKCPPAPTSPSSRRWAVSCSCRAHAAIPASPRRWQRRITSPSAPSCRRWPPAAKRPT